MSTPKRVLVTGTTGFVGSHLTYRLIESGKHVTAIARGSRTVSARERVFTVLHEVAAAVATSETSAPFDFQERLEVLDGDLTQEHLGMERNILANVAEQTDEIWHCAASLSFMEEDRDEIFAMNVDGTRRILDLAQNTRGRLLHHVSTAYVAGDRARALESEFDVGQTFRNAYEVSKSRAEKMVQTAVQNERLSAVIYRPSIVIGDSRTGRATHFHGVYAFIRGLWTVLKRLRRSLPAGQAVHLPLRVLGNPETTLNFVPIDYVVGGMLHIGRDSANRGRAFHLTNPYPTLNKVWLPTICSLLGVHGVELVDAESFEREPMTRMELMFQKQMAFYSMYLRGEPAFDCTGTLRALEGTGIECPPVTVAFIEKMVGWYVDYLQSGREPQPE